jgi:hypothetical protein
MKVFRAAAALAAAQRICDLTNGMVLKRRETRVV